ncbi:sigma-70 family RNA polymerase sigma factor [Kiloniella majae]|uniref:sigma-70 family RNA polymerase sigma factor n=1 Tax=Kiloniella majae TaxID=1938558 RepID=UPI000A27771A|nr:sigma-70 family RNA polymerase sigma factor [Kiloniella majae]
MSSIAHQHDLLQLFMLHRKDLVGYAKSIVGERHVAEDVVQDAYFRVIGVEKRKQGTILEEPVGYLYQIIRNLCLDTLRKKTRENSYMQEEDLSLISSDVGQISPEQHAGARQELIVLRAALNELPERTRLAFELHRFSGLKLVDIADRLDVSLGTAHAMVSSALEHCKTSLKRQTE